MRQLDGLSWTGSMLSTPLASDLGPGPERTAEERSAGRGVCSLRLSPPISSLARRRRRPGLALSWTESFAFYASRRRLRAWPAGGSGGARSLTGSLLSTPLAADFGPGPEAMAEERSAGRGVCFLRLSPPFLDLARRGRRTAAQLDGDYAFYGSCRRISAWPGGGGGGMHRWGVYFLCLSPQVTGLARKGRRRWLRWAQLDREFAFYASRRGLRSWTGSLLCTPLAAAIGPGPEPAVKGAQLDGQFALYAFRLRLRAWAAEGCAA